MALSSVVKMSCKWIIWMLLIKSLAHRAGVTTGVAFPISSSSSLLYGLSYAFTLAAPHALAPNAILNPAAALHMSLTAGKLSISTKIAALRRLLQGQVEEKSELTALFNKVHKGQVRLVIEVHKADVMAALLRLKKEVGGQLRLTFMGGFESWMASDVAKARLTNRLRMRSLLPMSV
jgi:hypothetical protein